MDFDLLPYEVSDCDEPKEIQEPQQLVIQIKEEQNNLIRVS